MKRRYVPYWHSCCHCALRAAGRRREAGGDLLEQQLEQIVAPLNH
jgi:hypothetical protein